MISLSTGASAQPQMMHKQMVRPPRFGRDAIFERNDRFDYRRSDPSKKMDQKPTSIISPIRQVLSKLFSPKKTPPAVAPNPAPKKEADFYTIQGRIRSKSVLKAALQQAMDEYKKLTESTDTPAVQKALAGIKLANAQLAADTDNEGAFSLLTSSLHLLKQEDYSPKARTAPPVYIHGLYNRGCYVLNNEIYRKTTDELGPEGMAYNDAGFEGLAITPPKNPTIRKSLEERLLEGLPYLKKAIILSEGIPDNGIARVEYLSAKGEVMHALSHLTKNLERRKQYDEYGLDAFKEALEVLESVDTQHYTPQHLKLREKLSEIKIPHMCSHQHRPEQAETLCAQLNTQGQALGNLMKSARHIHPVPDTPLEKLAKTDEEAEAIERDNSINPYTMLIDDLLFPEKGPAAGAS